MPRTSLLILNGPNLNLLGERQPELYGSQTLADIEAACVSHGEAQSVQVTCRQSNHEGELVSWVQEVRKEWDGLILNAGAYSHTSVALHDALMAVEKPIIEVHLSNIFRRESFRHHSYVSAPATGIICGLGSRGYLLAIDALAHQLKGKQHG